MVRNDSLTRIAMLLCFGTAILSLAVHWRISSTDNGLWGTEVRSEAYSDRYFKEPSSPVSSFMTPQTGSRTNVNTLSDPADANVKPRVFMQADRGYATAYDLPKLLLAQGLAKQKSSSNNLASGKTQVVVDLSDRRVYVYRREQVIASYPIGVGKKGWETPLGTFQVMNKKRNPIWRHPITDKVFPSGTNSPLGDRWIGFWSDGRNQIGFHGTPNNELVGAAISHGCLRMRNVDVRLLYNQVGLGTPVEVRL